MNSRLSEWANGHSPESERRIEQDLIRLRQLVLERHNIKIAEHDPVCIEFTVQSRILERAISAFREERQETVADLATIIQSSNHSINAILEEAGKPLAKTMAGTFDPRKVANLVMAELIDDLRRECRKAVLEARRIIGLAVGVTFAVCFVILYLASQRLSTAEQLLHLVGDPDDVTFEPPPLPPPSQP